MIEKHVISLDIAKRLHELGVKKPSLFWWGCGDYNAPAHVEIAPFQNEELWTYDKMYRAYTASELLDILPKEIWDDKGHIYPIVERGYYISHPDGFYFEDKKICDAIANMIIYLIENKIIEIK